MTCCSQNLKKKLRNRLSGRTSRDEEGFTLIELLIVVMVTPLIIGAIAIALVATFQLQSSVSNRLTDSGDAQVVTASFQNDVQSAVEVTTQPASSPQCGSGSQLLGLEWDGTTGGTFNTVVSYVTEQSGTSATTGAATYSLVRQYCDDGSLTPISSTTLSYDITAAQVAPTITWVTAQATTCAGAPTTPSCNPSSGWVSAQNIATIDFDVTEPLSKYEYTLDAVPAQSASTQPAGAPIVNTTTTSCNFATPGTGTYAGTLCFVNFALLNNAQNMATATAANGCLELSVALPGSYTLYFCLNISGSPVNAVAFPTYADAFLGNSINGVPFYIGVTGDPAIYQYQSGSLDTITISNIVVDNPEGVPATGWEAVGADAETTDPSESITFSSDQDLNVLANTPSSPMGDACNEPSSSNSANPGPGETDLTGVGTTTVECQSTWQATVPRTGTPMLWATTPSELTTTMQGSGLEGMAFGLLLS